MVVVQICCAILSFVIWKRWKVAGGIWLTMALSLMAIRRTTGFFVLIERIATDHAHVPNPLLISDVVTLPMLVSFSLLVALGAQYRYLSKTFDDTSLNEIEKVEIVDD